MSATGQRPEVSVNCHSRRAVHLVFLTGSLISSPIRTVWLVSRPAGSPGDKHTGFFSHGLWVFIPCPRALKPRAPPPESSFWPYYYFIIWENSSPCVQLPSFYSEAGLGCMDNTTGSIGKLYWAGLHKPRHRTHLLCGPHISLLAFILSEGTQKPSHQISVGFIPMGLGLLLGGSACWGDPRFLDYVFNCTYFRHTCSLFLGGCVLLSYFRNRLHIWLIDPC